MSAGNLGEQQRASSRATAIAASLVAAIALVVIAPALTYGFPAGHDTLVHATAWFDVVQHWHEGNLFPAWGARFASGLGEPVYLFYPPISLYLGGALLLVFGPAFAPAVFFWICAVIGGVGAYRAARLIAPQSALFAAAFYAASPYLALDAYDRNSFAELLAAAFFPFALEFTLRVARDRSGFFGLTLALFCIGLSDVPAALTIGLTLAIVAAVISLQSHSMRPVAQFAGASMLAGAWGAFYIIPAALQKKWVQIEAPLSGEGARGAIFVLFNHPTRPFEHNFVSAIQGVSLGYIALAILLCVMLFGVSRRESFPWLTAVSGTAALLMIPISMWIYEHVPLMRYIGFAWRFTLVLSLTCAVASAIVVRGKMKYAALAALLFAFGFGWRSFWPPVNLHDSTAIWNATFDQRTSELGPYRDDLPLTAPEAAFDQVKAMPRITIFGLPDTKVKILSWQSEQVRAAFDAPQRATLLFRINYFPGWAASINGKPVAAELEPNTGHIKIDVLGSGELVVTFRRTMDRQIAIAISLLSMAMSGLIFYRKQKGRTLWSGLVR